MTARASGAAPATVGEVVEELRRLFMVRRAAAYLDISPSTLNATRAVDVQRIREGLEPLGPRWHVLGKRITYFKEDLDAWIEREARAYAQISFSNRGKGTES